jgi:hypothetical protein
MPGPPSRTMSSAHGGPSQAVPAFCANCRRQTAGSRFCGECGQRRGDLDMSLRNVVPDAIAELFSVEGRSFRTLRLLFGRPGALTAEFVGGRQARYTPPLRLYLAASAIFFLGFLATRGIDRAYYGLEGGAAAAYANTMARVLIALIPLVALILRVLYPRRTPTFVHQLVFSLHFGALALLWMLALTLVAAVLKAVWGHHSAAPGWLPDFAVWLYLPGMGVLLVRLAAWLRGAWGGGRVAAGARTLAVAAAFAGVLFVGVPGVLNALG